MTMILIATVVVLVLILIGVAVAVSLKGEEAKAVLPYRLKKFFFTRSEQQFFRELNQQLDHDRYAVFPKVRLGDFVEVDLPKSERAPYWSRIRSRHIDFLLWDLAANKIALAIEVDGNSHNSERARASDEFKDDVYEAIGLKLVRVRVGSDFKSEIALLLDQVEGASSEDN